MESIFISHQHSKHQQTTNSMQIMVLTNAWILPNSRNTKIFLYSLWQNLCKIQTSVTDTHRLRHSAAWLGLHLIISLRKFDFYHNWPFFITDQLIFFDDRLFSFFWEILLCFPILQRMARFYLTCALKTYGFGLKLTAHFLLIRTMFCSHLFTLLPSWLR
jgi:hypothetical protein